MTNECAREIKAVYAFRGLDVEMSRTLPLRPGEEIILEGSLWRYAVGIITRPAYVRLSSLRLCFLEHYMTRRDRVTEVTAGALHGVETEGERVVVTWRTCPEDLRHVALLPGGRRLPV